jgi:hypothetical protein
MGKLFLGVSAAALISSAGYVTAQTTNSTPAPSTVDHPSATATPSDDGGTRMRLAAMDTSVAAFRKLDGDNDGRISALEAADNPRVAAAFTMGDKDKDGYLSREEFQSMSSSSARPSDVDASTPSGDRVSEPNGDQPASGPNEPSPTSTSPEPRMRPPRQ